MALTVEIKNEKDSFVVSAIITSDNIDNLYSKMQTDAFRIDIADKLYALANGGQVKEKLDELENPDLTPAERETINNDIVEFEDRIGTPIITIDKNNFARYFNSDDESLLENGVQIMTDGNSMVIRFAPIQNVPFLDGYIDLCVLHCVIGFDFDDFDVTNRKAFDVCLMPKLITGEVEKENPADPDPILPDDANRPGYVFNEEDAETDSESLYVNNGKLTVSGQEVPLEIIRTSAYITDYAYDMIGNSFLWNTSESILADEAAGTSIQLPFTVNGGTDLEHVDIPDPISGRIINDDSIESSNNTLTGLMVYEVIQQIKTTGDEAYVKDSVKFAVDV